MTYLDGELEIMTPSRTHEQQKTRLGRLLEAWSEEAGIELEGAGSWTLRSELRSRGLEPDECYFVGHAGAGATAPDVAIEVVWTSRITTSASPRSELLPALDPEMLGRYMMDATSQAQAVRELRASMRSV